MLNYARTLLMNVDGTAGVIGYPAEELTDPAFLAIDLPGFLVKVRAALFGANPDKTMLAYRCRQLLAVAHATPLAGYLLDLDPRITYAFDDPTLVYPNALGPVVTFADGPGLICYGAGDPPDASGRMSHALSVTVDVPGVAAVERLSAPFQKADFTFDPSDRLPLVGTGVEFRLLSAAAGQLYRVSLYLRPRRTISDLAIAVAGLGDPVRAALFDGPEPYRTFSALWSDSLELPLRVAALVCAIVYRSEAARLGKAV